MPSFVALALSTPRRADRSACWTRTPLCIENGVTDYALISHFPIGIVRFIVVRSSHVSSELRIDPPTCLRTRSRPRHVTYTGNNLYDDAARYGADGRRDFRGRWSVTWLGRARSSGVIASLYATHTASANVINELTKWIALHHVRLPLLSNCRWIHASWDFH